ncbi:hypothetical protein E0K89_003425 [Aquicoccus sp. SCR17]|nr:hypothetical protein [Carideicomes alvinocaridis]
MSIFAIFMVMAIFILGGIGVDFMYNEIRRVKLQNTLDRAILAAADLEQTLPAESVVRDYFTKAGLSASLGRVSVDQDTTHKTVSAEADEQTKSLFLRLLGVDRMTAFARGTAEERVNEVEISLVLDISGSMRDNDKLGHLQDAAGAFVDSLVNPGTAGRVSLSLVPYSEHVNVGPAIYDKLHTIDLHPYSHCLEIPDDQFGSAALDMRRSYEQAQHFQWNYYGTYSDLRVPVCPQESYERITPFSQNAAALRRQIDSFQPRAGTSIFLGMKWAAAMLDPSFRGITAQLAAEGAVDATFAARPVSYDDPETVKTIVLMTDGMNDYSNRISRANYSDPDQRAVWARYGLWSWYYNYRNRYEVEPLRRWDGQFLNAVSDGDDTDEPVFYMSRSSDLHEQKYSPAQGDALLDDICDAAKARGIIVWTIGFEVSDHGAEEMESCASSPSHFYRVEGVEIERAFRSIAGQISELKLVR